MRYLIFGLLLAGALPSELVRAADTPLHAAAADNLTGDGLSFNSALDLAEHTTPLLAAQNAKVAAAQAAAIPADALPDPKLAIGVDNLPISGADRGQLDSDFMTMQKIGVMQEFPAAAKRSARVAIATAVTERARAERNIARQQVRSATAQAWLQRFYLEQQVSLLAALQRENELLQHAVRAQLSSGKGAAADSLLPQQEALKLADRHDILQQQIDSAKATLQQWIGTDAYLPLQGSAPQFALDPATLQQHIHKHPELAAFGPKTAEAEAELLDAQAQKQSDWSVELDYQRRGPLYSDMVSLEFTYALPVSTATRQTPNIVAKQQALLQLDNERETMLREHAAELTADNGLYRALSQQLARLDDSRLPLAQQRIDLLMASYRAGQSDLASVIGARRELLEIKARRIELLSQQAQLAAKLHFSYEEVAP